MAAFACPPDCGHCCTHLEPAHEEGAGEFRAVLREQGIYSCPDVAKQGLALSNAEAATLHAEAARRKLRVKLHPRTFLLETRRRLAVVIDWHLAHASCPFYQDYLCTVYEARPLVCRAYPVMFGSPLRFAPACPKAPAPRASVRAELRARTAIEAAHARIDADVWRAMERGRFAKGLAARDAHERAGRYRPVPLDAFLAAGGA